MDLGEKLKRYRKEHHLTQAELAKRLGTSQSAVNMYENAVRTPNASTMSRISSVLGLTAFEVGDIICGGEFVKETEDTEYDINAQEKEVYQIPKRYFSISERKFLIDLILHMYRDKNNKQF